MVVARPDRGVKEIESEDNKRISQKGGITERSDSPKSKRGEIEKGWSTTLDNEPGLDTA